MERGSLAERPLRQERPDGLRLQPPGRLREEPLDRCRPEPPHRIGGGLEAAPATGVSLGICCVLMSLCSLASAAEPTPKESPSRRPFFDARQHRTEYAGPGRELPAPAEIEEILIGYFGPSDPEDPQGGDMWRAAQLALEEANAGGGYRGKPLRLVPAWSENPWGTGVAQVARMVYQDRVWAIIGGIDGNSTHLAEQVVAKARLTLLSPASTDKTVNLANVPWMFSCLPGDHLQAPVLAAEIESRVGQKPFLIVSTDDHDARLCVVELRKSLAARQLAPRYHFKCKRGSRELGELAARVVQAKPDAVALVAGADDSARLLSAIRTQGFGGPVFGGPAMGRRRFLEEAEAAAEGAVFPLLCEPGGGSQQFVRIFKSRFGRPPDYAAAHTYDAVRLLVAAIRRAGLNRARIRDAVEDLSPWRGTAGTISWDRLGANTRAVRLGTIRHGRVVPLADSDRLRAASYSR